MQFPHCDSRVLHAPGECKYCDDCSDWQRVREVWGIAFTGHDPLPDQTACPAERERPREVINRWGGNTPKPKDGVRVGFDWAGYEVVESRPKFRQRIADAAQSVKDILTGLSE